MTLAFIFKMAIIVISDILWNLSDLFLERTYAGS